jgi:hypothetical protein
VLRSGDKVGAAFVILGATMAGALACDGIVSPVRCSAPVISGATVASSSDNVLSAIVSSKSRGADSILVRFGLANSSRDSVTAAVGARDDSARVSVFGLLPKSRYEMQLVAVNACGSVMGAVLHFATDSLPSDLPVFTASGTNPSPGYVTFASGNFGLVINNSGRVVWYHRFPEGPGLNFQPQPNGTYAARPTPVSSSQTATWTEIDTNGKTTRTLSCAHGLGARLHDLIAERDGSYWLMCDEIRSVDLSSVGLSRQASVMGTDVEHISATGAILFEWSPFGNIDLDVRSLSAADRTGPIINWTHGNAIDLDADGNLLVSFRNLSEILKIDTRTGGIIWRLGGALSDFKLPDGTTPPFIGQHGVRSVGVGRIELLDNLGIPGVSRAELYEYSEGSRTAVMTATYVSSPKVVAQIGGSTQRLANGHTLVSFGNGASVNEYDADGNIVWRIDGIPGYVFRAERILSLYHPGQDYAR